MIGDHLEMHEQFIVDALKKKLENLDAGGDFEIEGTIDETKMPRTAPIQPIDLPQHGIDIEWPSSFVQRRQTKLALERATARGFDINEALRDIFVGVKRIG